MLVFINSPATEIKIVGQFGLDMARTDDPVRHYELEWKFPKPSMDRESILGCFT